jgi:hypothetical protein
LSRTFPKIEDGNFPRIFSGDFRILKDKTPLPGFSLSFYLFCNIGSHTNTI